MTIAPRIPQQERKDLDKLAERLGSCSLQLRAQEGEIVVVLSATFAPVRYESGDYVVSVGLTEANLRFEHDGHDVDQKYGATLADEFWTAQAQEKSQTGGAVEGEIGLMAKLQGWVHIGAKTSAHKSKETKATSASKTVMPLIEPSPSGWRIGGPQGDPRWAAESAVDGLENCLRGDYFHGAAGEKPQRSAKAGRACVLRPREGGNAFLVRASLYGAAGALRVALQRKDGAISPLERNAADKRAEQIKRALAKICVGKAGKDQSGLSGETFLHRMEKGAPKLGPSARAAKPK